MFKYILSGLLLGAAHGMTVPVAAEPTKGYHTMDSMGCMMLLECTDNVKRITSIQDIIDRYPDSDYDAVAREFNDIIASFDRVGVKVFLADTKYFPPGHRGVYHTVGNNFFLNDAFMHLSLIHI